MDDNLLAVIAMASDDDKQATLERITTSIDWLEIARYDGDRADELLCVADIVLSVFALLNQVADSVDITIEDAIAACVAKYTTREANFGVTVYGDERDAVMGYTP
jgi:hypothetical protein